MIELMWDAGHYGTATAPSGASLCVGENVGFTPEDLLAAAAAACFMKTFLHEAAAADVPILAFTASAHVEPRHDSTVPVVHVRSFVVGPSHASEDRLRDLIALAERTSPIAQVLGDRATWKSDVQILGWIEESAMT